LFPHLGQNRAVATTDAPQLGQVIGGGGGGPTGAASEIFGSSISFRSSTTSTIDCISSHETWISDRVLVVTIRLNFFSTTFTPTSFTLPTDEPLLSITCMPMIFWVGTNSPFFSVMLTTSSIGRRVEYISLITGSTEFDSAHSGAWYEQICDKKGFTLRSVCGNLRRLVAT